jgi:hypothetical protein
LRRRKKEIILTTGKKGTWCEGDGMLGKKRKIGFVKEFYEIPGIGRGKEKRSAMFEGDRITTGNRIELFGVEVEGSDE